MSFGQFGIGNNGPTQERIDLFGIEFGITGTLPFPETHSIVVKSQTIIRLKLGVAAETVDDFSGLAGRTVVRAGEKFIHGGIGRIKVRTANQESDGVVI